MDSLSRMIEEKGWQCRVVPIGHLADLKEAILGRLGKGLIDKTLFREKLGFMSFDFPANLPDVRSIIIVALPTRQMRIFFNWHGVRIPVILPPTYVSYTPRTRSVQAVLKDWFEDRTEFSGQETALLIQSVPFNDLPPETTAKINSLEINEGYDQLCRNLRKIVSR